MELLAHTNPARHAEILQASRSERRNPPVPIPASWFDEDYFDHGIKSNWSNGYLWEHLRGVFEKTSSVAALP